MSGTASSQKPFILSIQTSLRSGKLDSVPTPGKWTEQIDGTLPALRITQNNQWREVKVPANYGVMYVQV